ncbi:protein FIP1-like isoform X1 [Wolffia australiana]
MSRERLLPSTSTAEENNLFQDVQAEVPLSGHRQRASILGSVMYCFLLAGYAVVAAAAPWIFSFIPKLIPPLLCSCNIFLLVITGFFQQYWVTQVKKVRLQGYYTFSERLRHIVRIPFSIVSYGTAIMLLAVIWRPYIHILSTPTLLRATMIVEAFLVCCFKSAYIGCIHQYNSLHGQPDILQSLYSALQPSSSLEDLRYYDSGRLSDQQMALLQYQRENMHYLCEEVIRLQECLSKYKRADNGSIPQVDLAHLLAARDQELRAKSAEMDQVTSELCLARSLIADQDAEIKKIWATNNQYVEENERLRAILAEWSARAAKLERALEGERVSGLELQWKIESLTAQLSRNPESAEIRES